jgi:2-dehydropantoate 2-reductase
MRFVVYGAGAVGGVIGGRLSEAGHDVTLIARGAHLEALRGEGLSLVDPDGPVTLRVPAVAHPADADLRDGDVVILAMKSQGTGSALSDLAAHAPAEIRVVCAQNGVANERMALRLFAHVYAMSVMLPATHLEPGVVAVHVAPVSGLLDVGRYPAGVDAAADDIAAALSGAGFASDARPDIMRWKYRKLILNLGNAVEAVCGPEAARSSPLGRLVRDEGEECLRAAGIDAVSIEDDRERRRRGGFEIRDVPGHERRGGSSWQSLARGLGTVETDYLTGEIVLLGRLHGVATPANEVLQRLANQMAADGRSPGSVPVEDVLARLG